jgi:hypothetical protein
MAEAYLGLSREDKLAALGVAATATGRADYLLEKDIWVTWALQGLFESKLGEHLVFKGGTSLSKGYSIIERFSEDVDLTYDVRKVIPELATGDAPLPATTSQAKKWSERARERLPTWVKDEVLPVLEKHEAATGAEVTFRVEGDVIYVDYDRVTEGTGLCAALGQAGVWRPFDGRSVGGTPRNMRRCSFASRATIPDR